MSAYAGNGKGMRVIVADEGRAMTLANRLAILLDDQIHSAENGQFERVESLMGRRKPWPMKSSRPEQLTVRPGRPVGMKSLKNISDLN